MLHACAIFMDVVQEQNLCHYDQKSFNNLFKIMNEGKLAVPLVWCQLHQFQIRVWGQQIQQLLDQTSQQSLRAQHCILRQAKEIHQK